MADLHTCPCGFVTAICRDEVTADQWGTFESLHSLAYTWAVDHLTDESDPEGFATRFAGEHWDNPEPPSFPAQHAGDLRAAEEAQQQARAVERAEQRAAARAADARRRATARRRARAAT